MKNKPQHIWLTFLLMTPEGKLLQSIPWTERDYGSNTAQKQRKRTVSEVNQKINKLCFEDVFREKIIAEYDSQKNFLCKSRFE